MLNGCFWVVETGEEESGFVVDCLGSGVWVEDATDADDASEDGLVEAVSVVEAVSIVVSVDEVPEVPVVESVEAGLEGMYRARPIGRSATPGRVSGRLMMCSQ